MERQTDPVEVGIRALGHVVVDDNVDSLNVHASSKQIGGHHYPLVETLECLVLGQPGERQIEGEMMQCLMLQTCVCACM